jgi:preprotein translocase subunit SecG
MSILVTTLFVITALLLIAIVLIQQPKTAGGLFAGTGQSLLGTSGKTFWTKATTIVAAVFMALCLLMAALPKFRDTGSPVAEMIEKQQQQAAQPAAAAASAAPQEAPKAQTNQAPPKAPPSGK